MHPASIVSGERNDKQLMNAVALNNWLSVQYDNSTGTAATRTAADSQPFSAYLSAQLSDGFAETAAENTEPEMTLYEAAAARRNAVIDTNSADIGTAQSEAVADVVTLNETAGVDTDNSALMMLLLMMMGSSGENSSMNTAMMSLLSGIQGEGLNSLLGTSSLSEIASILTGQLTNATGQTIVNEAMTRLGDPYSKSKRGTGNYVDCSYLAQWAYKQAGIDIPGTPARQAQYCHENGYEITKDELKPGDLIFWTKHSSNAGRWHNIHHVGIYAGNGRIVEAKNPQNGVEVADMWGMEGNGGDWEIVMYARPR